MKNKIWFYVLILGLCLTSFAFIYGCGANPTSGGGTTSGIANRDGTYSYSGTQSPGDVWSWTISTETFFGSNETTGMRISGTWQTLVSGFGKATISISEGPDKPSVGDKAYFLEFPNTMLLVRPDNATDSRVMVCAASATIEPNQGKYIYVNIPESGWDLASPSYGTVEVSDISAKRKNFDITPYTITGEPVAGGHMNYNFIYSNGTFTEESGADDTKVFMTPSNVFFGDSGTGKGGFAGASLEASSSFTSDFDHVFKGVRFIYYSDTLTGETEPVTCSKIATREALLANSYSDVDAGTLMGQGVIITFEAQQPTGFRRGYVTDLGDGHSEIIQCTVSRVGPAGNRKHVVFGIGLDDRNRSFNFLLIEQ